MTHSPAEHGNREYFFFYNQTKIESAKSELTGAEVKGLIAAQFPLLDRGHTLVLEGHGNHEDLPIADDRLVSLVPGEGEGAKRFFTRPPADFGC